MVCNFSLHFLILAIKPIVIKLIAVNESEVSHIHRKYLVRIKKKKACTQPIRSYISIIYLVRCISKIFCEAYFNLAKSMVLSKCFPKALGSLRVDSDLFESDLTQIRERIVQTGFANEFTLFI